MVTIIFREICRIIIVFPISSVTSHMFPVSTHGSLWIKETIEDYKEKQIKTLRAKALCSQQRSADNTTQH